jgi:hypothetical protein
LNVRQPLTCFAAALGLLSAPVATAIAVSPTAAAHRCAPPKYSFGTTLSVKGMECNEGMKIVRKVVDRGPFSIPFHVTRRYHVTGWTGSPLKTLRHFTCAVRYDNGTGANRGGIRFSINCHDFKGDAVHYAEEQDNE